MGTQENKISTAELRKGKNILYLAVGFSGKQWNVHATSFFEAVKELEENTRLPETDPNHIAPGDVFLLMDVPG